MTEEGEDAPDWVIATQSQLGAIIRRPKLSTALLKKPPFRFLHDIVSEVCCSDEGVSRHTEWRVLRSTRLVPTSPQYSLSLSIASSIRLQVPVHTAQRW